MSASYSQATSKGHPMEAFAKAMEASAYHQGKTIVFLSSTLPADRVSGEKSSIRNQTISLITDICTSAGIELARLPNSEVRATECTLRWVPASKPGQPMRYMLKIETSNQRIGKVLLDELLQHTYQEGITLTFNPPRDAPYARPPRPEYTLQFINFPPDVDLKYLKAAFEHAHEESRVVQYKRVGGDKGATVATTVELRVQAPKVPERESPRGTVTLGGYTFNVYYPPTGTKAPINKTTATSPTPAPNQPTATPHAVDQPEITNNKEGQTTNPLAAPVATAASKRPPQTPGTPEDAPPRKQTTQQSTPFTRTSTTLRSSARIGGATTTTTTTTNNNNPNQKPSTRTSAAPN